ncbi:hypothetical protein SLEP1_g49322 [Rubroshorea leprosula]|uniref:CCHC-type domain-containing protein n=1 Tax=Rubroshorea leprosula TaxID=152421 RepID=A0AAV5LWF5_9ROSI|nr:hypothetical protein SLEP1_g49322 [Rubroshorea leprosula]
MSEKEKRRDMELRMVADLTGFENLKGFIEGEALMKMNKGKKHRTVASSEKEIRRQSEFRMLADLTGFDNLKALMEGEALMKMKKGKRKRKRKVKKKEGVTGRSEEENRRDAEFRMLADLTGFDNLKALMEGEALMKRKQRKKKKKMMNGDIQVDAPQQIMVDAAMVEETVKKVELSETDSLEILENPWNFAESSVILIASSDDDKQEERPVANESRIIVDKTVLGNYQPLLQGEPSMKRRKRRRRKKKKKNVEFDAQQQPPVNVPMDGEQTLQEETADIVDISEIESIQKSTTTSDEPQKLVVDAAEVNMLVETAKLVETRSEENVGGIDSTKDIDLCSSSSKDDRLISNVISSISTGEMILVPTVLNEENKTERRMEPNIILTENNVVVRKEEKQAEKHKGVEAEKQAEKHKVVERMKPVDVGKKGKQVEKCKDAETMTPPEARQVENIVLQSLLRKPRYFDSPDGSWVACCKCGGGYHEAADCILERKKPCYMCGSLQHNGKHCRKVQNHLIRTERVHHKSDSNICLRCGNAGHDMFSCRSNYSQDDINKIQCYMCKSFGHLCCVNIPDTGPREISCYNCGHSGHLGDDCEEHGNRRGRRTHVACYRCGEEGHFARRCNVYRKYGKMDRRIRMSEGSSSAPPGFSKPQNNKENHNPRMDVHRYKESFAFQHHQERYDRVGPR